MTHLDCAFLIRDLGDTQALSPLAHRLKQQGKKIRILALGQASFKALQDDKLLAGDVVAPEMVKGVKSRLGTAPSDFGGGQGHDTPLTCREDAHVLARALRAPVVVTGVVSRPQQQVVAAFRTPDAGDAATKIVGCYDSSALNKKCFLFRGAALLGNDITAAGAAQAGAQIPANFDLDELWVPYTGLIAGVAAAAHVPSSCRTVAVGSPSSEATLRDLAALETKRASIRATKLGAAADDRIVFYAGGRDGPGQTSYATSFEIFVQTAIAMPAPCKGRLIFLAGLHPASDGQVERTILERLHGQNIVRLVRTVANPVMPREISTNELTVASDDVVTWNSTVASQAAQRPPAPTARHVLFIDGDQQADRFAVVEQGLAAQVGNVPDALQFLSHTEAPTTAQKPSSPSQAADSVTLMVERLAKLGLP